MDTESRIVSLETRLADLESKLELVMKELRLSAPSDAVRSKVEQILRSGDKRAAILAYHEATNCDLKQAKDYVEELERSLTGR